MSDPRSNDPNYRDPPLKDRRDKAIDRTWAWIAGIAVVLLIGFIVVAGWNTNSNTASNQPQTPPAATGSAPPSITGQPPSTTGQAPSTPRPSTPPAPSGNQ